MLSNFDARACVNKEESRALPESYIYSPSAFSVFLRVSLLPF